MRERGASEEQVIEAITKGRDEPVRQNRIMYRLNLEYNADWAGKHYAVKQVAPVVGEETDRLVVVAVYTLYL